MPESKGRKKPAYTPPPAPVKVRRPRRWIAPAMIVFFVLGVLWLSIWYIARPDIIADLANWNLAIGFSMLLVGFVLATKWE